MDNPSQKSLAGGGELRWLCIGLALSPLSLFAAQVDDVITVAAATMATGVTCGGTVFAVRFLWRLFQRLLGESTWRE